jgi:hypothetical protein
MTNYSYLKNGIYMPEIDVFINQCTYFKAQATITVVGNDICLQAYLDGTLNKKYKCDMDKDGVPDICDDDIDGDGIKNLVGLITHENPDCSINQTNVNQELLQKHFQNICSLDNAPFIPNQDQLDLNGDGIGDADMTMSAINPANMLKDSDGDGIPDTQDLCPSINGMGSENGCPQIENDILCNLQTAYPSSIISDLPLSSTPIFAISQLPAIMAISNYSNIPIPQLPIISGQIVPVISGQIVPTIIQPSIL